MKKEEIIKLAKQLLAFRSAHGRPQEIGACLDFCAEYFADLPVTVRRFEDSGVPSLVIQNCGGEELDVLFLGHIDVADAPDEYFTPRTENGRLYGRGTCDMKAFVASSMVAVRDLVTEGVTARVGLAIVTDEETGGEHGAHYLSNTVGYRAKVVLVPDDGDDISTVVSRSKHGFGFRFIAKGKSAHGNRPWDGVNAIEMLIQTYARLREAFPTATSKPENNWVNSLNLGTVSGGVASNEVPADAEMAVDIRIVPPTTRNEVLAAVNTALIPGVSVALEVEVQPTLTPETDPFLAAYSTEVERVTGKPVKFKWSGGATDARHFAARGMTTIVHQGTCGDAQGENEFVDIASLSALVEIQKRFIKNKLTPKSKTQLKT